MTQSRLVPTGEGEITAIVHRTRSLPSAGTTVVVLAHGAGGDMHHPLLIEIAEQCAAEGLIAVRFNFPYAEAGRRAPDRMPALERAVRDVAAWARAQKAWNVRRLVVGGKSMGGRAASRCVAEQGEAHLAADGLVLLGYPLHPSGEPESLRIEHLGAIRIPCLFVEGTRDGLCDLAQLLPALSVIAAPVSLHLVYGGDHSFHVPVRSGRGDDAVYAEIASAIASWVRVSVRRR